MDKNRVQEGGGYKGQEGAWEDCMTVMGIMGGARGDMLVMALFLLESSGYNSVWRVDVKRCSFFVEVCVPCTSFGVEKS